MAAPNQGPIVVTALFGPEDFAWLEGLRRRHYPADRNRVPAHLTLFRHLSPSLEDELNRRLGVLTAGPPPRARIAGIIDLDGGTAFRVESEGLEALRGELADAFRGMLIPQDMASWRPHVTIQNKVEPKAAKALQQALQAGFQPRPLAIRGIATWRYAEGMLQPLKSRMFRG